MDLEFDLRGVAELDALLASLEESLQPKVLGDALTMAAQPVVTAAKALAPVRTGKLRDSIRVQRGLSRRERRRRRSVLAAHLGLRSGRNLTREEGRAVDVSGAAVVTVTAGVPYAHLVEFGHATVRVDRGLLLTTTTVTGFVAPHPFMRPAWDSTRSVVERSFREAVAAAVANAARRAPRRAA